MTEGQRVVRCSLGGEQFLFVHEEASHTEKAEVLTSAGLSSHQIVYADPTGWTANFPWSGYVYSAELSEWIYRGQFNNDQVANMVDYTVGSS